MSIEIHVLELRGESGEIVDRAVRKAEAFFYLAIALTISLSAVLAQAIIKGFDILSVIILIFGLIIEVRTIKEIMSYESALVEGAKLTIFVGKRLDEARARGSYEESQRRTKDAQATHKEIRSESRRKTK